MRKILVLVLFLGMLLPVFGAADTIPAALQTGYLHDSVRVTDYSDRVEGFILFEPAAPQPDSASVLIFHHGFGALNPAAYGGWIRHIVRQGTIVIFPRYQQTYFRPSPGKFPAAAATAILRALDTLRTPGHVYPWTEDLILVGHSYGGTISAYLGVHGEEMGLPEVKGMLLSAPGTGPARGARLRSYEAMSPDLKLLIVSHKKDRVVGRPFQKRIFETAVQTPMRNFILQYPDKSASPALSAGHDECYSFDPSFDNGLSNPTVRRYTRYSRTNALDYNGYWKLLDALSDCIRYGTNCETAFGDTPEQRFLGLRPNGVPYRELEVTLPKN